MNLQPSDINSKIKHQLEQSELVINKYNQDRFDNKNFEIENVNSAVINKRDVVTFNQFHDNQIEKDFKQIQYPLDEDECVDFST